MRCKVDWDMRRLPGWCHNELGESERDRFRMLGRLERLLPLLLPVPLGVRTKGVRKPMVNFVRCAMGATAQSVIAVDYLDYLKCSHEISPAS